MEEGENKGRRRFSSAGHRPREAEQDRGSGMRRTGALGIHGGDLLELPSVRRIGRRGYRRH